MKVNRIFIQMAAVIALLAITIGTLEAHVFKGLFSLHPYGSEVFETGLRYQFYHIFAVALVGVIYYNAQRQMIKWAGILFIIGTVLFSGSMYMYAYAVGKGNFDVESVFGHIAPVGGFCLIAAWLLVIFSLAGRKVHRKVSE